MRQRFSELLSAAVVTIALLAAVGLKSLGLGVPLQVLALTLGVVLSAALLGFRGGLFSSVLTVLAFNYWFTTPYYTLLVDDPQNYLVFAFLLTTGVLVGRLADDRERRAREDQANLLLRGLSHDLRTPLAVIGGMASSLRRAPQLGSEGEHQVSTIEHEVESLTHRVENLLILSRLAATTGRRLRERFVPIPAEELLYSCRDKFAIWRPGRPFTVLAPAEVPLVRVEPTLLEQALVNLVDNADRLSPRGAEIVLRVEVRNGTVRWGVLDRGPGVPEAQKQEVFRLYVSEHGSGLGLALVAQIVRLHDGDCGVRDRHGGGSEFWMEVPEVTQ
jgi:two-component system sensor histidine kinase KdpD